MSTELLKAIDAARNLLEEIHSIRIKFVNERQPAVENRVIGGQHKNIIQAEKIGAININSREDEEEDLEPQDLILAKVDIVPGASHSDLVVDATVPYAVTPSGSIYVISLSTRTKRPVKLQRVRPVVLLRREPRRVCITTHITGVITPRKFTTDLESEQPMLHGQWADSSFTISSTDFEEFQIEPVARTSEVTWGLRMDWYFPSAKREDLRQGTALLGGRGGAFEIYPLEAAPSTNCDGFQHEVDCPAQKLRKLDPRAPRSTFTSVRDPQNECWLGTGMLGYM